jgi:hypothetical protein
MKFPKSLDSLQNFHLHLTGRWASALLAFAILCPIPARAAQESGTQQNARSKAVTTSLGEKSSPSGTEVALQLVARKQAFAATKSLADTFDREVLSPKSAIYSEDGSKFYVNSLEGCTTLAYDARHDSQAELFGFFFQKIHHDRQFSNFALQQSLGWMS